MLKWRTSVATLPRIRGSTGTAVAPVLVYQFLFLPCDVSTKSQGSSFLRFDLFNMRVTDMDVGKNGSRGVQ